MKKLLIVLALSLAISKANAQITLAHAYNFSGSNNYSGFVANLSISGKKIVIAHAPNADSLSSYLGWDTIFFYNLDYSLWKQIVCPVIPGYRLIDNIYAVNTPQIGFFYPSETLFNNDPLLEAAIFYYIPGSGGITYGNYYIINETGAIVDSITNVWPNMTIHEVDTAGIGFQAMMSSPTGVNIYNLPGTLPCNICGNGLGLAKVEKGGGNLETMPIPNPSGNEVKITFTLPDGVNMANLVLYNTMGQILKTYQVDRSFGYIMLDNTALAPGLYYYNIEVNGNISSTQKLVVIK